MSDPLADLKRRAYARPDGDADALAAQAELAALALERKREEAGISIPAPPPFRVAGTRSKFLLAVAALGAAALAEALVATLPVDSLRVFELPPSSTDPAPPAWMLEVMEAGPERGDSAIPESVRWLGNEELSTLFGYRMESGAVCVLLIVGDGGAGTCATTAEFRLNGLQLGGHAQFPLVTWGPTGDPDFSRG